jgi:hypothetical protein
MVPQARSHLTLDDRLVALNQRTGGLVVAGSNSLDKVGKAAFGHSPLPSGQVSFEHLLYSESPANMHQQTHRTGAKHR